MSPGAVATPDVVRLEEALDEARFGGKAVQLGAAARAGLPVPRGIALAVDLVDAMAQGQGAAIERVQRTCARLRGVRVAVRSSAVGEDAEHASFAGQHLTRLNVAGARALVEAATEVWASGRSEAALAYRARLGIDGAPAVGVIVQEMVEPDCAGVLFTRNPTNGADERVIEAAWGLGEAVVAGLVEPDRYHLSREGTLLRSSVGDKDVQVVARPDGSTATEPVAPARRGRPCLDDRRLERLHALAGRCERHFEGAHDIEWAFAGDRLHLLQRRSITR